VQRFHRGSLVSEVYVATLGKRYCIAVVKIGIQKKRDIKGPSKNRMK